MYTDLDSPALEETLLDQRLPAIYRSVLEDFRKLLSSSLRFHGLFLSLIALEVIAAAAAPFFILPLTALFLTLFSYLILVAYQQAKKPEQILLLVSRFSSSCRSLLSPSQQEAGRLAIASSLTRLAGYLEDFSPPAKQLGLLTDKLHRPDVFRFKQLLLHAAIQEILSQIRLTPTDLETHASLASAYVAFSRLFAEPLSEPALSFYRKRQELFDGQFRQASRFALEEFCILSQYAPDDPWVREQLASGYRALGMPAEETREIECLLRLKPGDADLLARAGALYFAQGLHAKGLQTYESLKTSHPEKAEALIENYGSLFWNFP